MSGIFGGSKSKQSSSNQSTSNSSSSSKSWNEAYPWLQETYGGMGTGGVNAFNLAQAGLGVGGDPAAATDAFNAFKKSSGFDAMLRGGMEALEGGAASRGLLNSGATVRGATRLGSDMAQQMYGSWLDKLLGTSQQGLSAGNLISGAGNRSESQSQSSSQSSGTSSGTSNSKNGLGGFLGSALSAIPSDPRLKVDAVKVGEQEGLGVYEYRYVWDKPDVTRKGYMADEVERLRPDALGPELPGGYRTVNYTKLPTIH